MSGQLKVEDAIDYSEKWGLVVCKKTTNPLPITFDVEAFGAKTFSKGINAKDQ